MSVRIIHTITITHHVCPENEYLSDEELIEYSFAGFMDDPAVWIASPAVKREDRVERDG